MMIQNRAARNSALGRALTCVTAVVLAVAASIAPLPAAPVAVAVDAGPAAFVSHSITINPFGGGHGAVVSDPAGIDCGADCTGTFADGTLLKLTATAEPGSSFVGWTGCPDPRGGSCYLEVATNVTVGAAFTLATRPLLYVVKAGTGSGTVASSPAGIDCGLDCDQDYDPGTVVQLTATAASGSSFTGWTDCPDPQGAICDVSLSASLAVTATFLDASSVAALIAASIATPSITVTGAAFAALPPGPVPGGVLTGALGLFPFDGPGFGALTTGRFSSILATGTTASTDNGGGNVRGDTDYDVVVLRVDLTTPVGANCLAFNFRFLSEEYPAFAGGTFNDAFVAELDETTWSTSGSSISAPGNIAPDAMGNVVSVNSTGIGGMSAAAGAGTAFDGAGPDGHGGGTSPLQAAIPVSPGAHSLYLSLFDQGDPGLDSAVFLDNLRTSSVADPGADCVPEAIAVVAPEIVTQPADASGAPGTKATFSAAANGVPVPSIQWQRSPDGTTWVNIPGATVSPLEITLAGADHLARIRAVFASAAGVSYTSAATIRIPDSTPPTRPGTPLATLRTGASTSGSQVPVRVTWAASADAITGLASPAYTLQRSVNGGSFTTVATSAGTSADVMVAAGSAVRFRVTARDRAGNAAISLISLSRSSVLVQQTSTTVKYGGVWSSQTATAFSGGSARYASVAGRSATYVFTGRTIALVSTRATARGKVRIYVGGVLQATVDLTGATQYRTIAWQKTYATSATRAVKLVVVGTAGRPRVDLDAFIVVR